ncbi:hypothetical protein B0O80DRAFT_459746 [Mortierella sp. GBAus27b]|nr:hypothetical protein B0O80DRAFT_459746 [Mortierella sp. GBAus27b]
MRSESASSAIHSLCSSTTSSHSQGHTPAFPPPQQQQRPSSQQPRRRQNLHQPILLRPVSLPSLTEVGPSSLYHSRPPPGQPLYQSLPYQASPSSLISVSSAASSGTGLSTGTGSTLHMALGIDIGGVDAEPPLTDVSRGSSPVHSPETLFLSTAPLSMPRSGFDHSPPRVPHTHNQQDAHWYSQEQEQRDGEQEHLHHNQQQQQHHRLQSRHLSGDSIMDKGQRSSVSLSRSNSRSGGGGMSVSSSSGATTLVSSSSMQSLHRHSASLPALRHDFLMQGPMSSDDPVHPSTYRKNSASHVDHVTPKAPRKTPSPPTFTSSSSSSFLQKPAAGDEDSVQGLMIKLPPNDV